MPRRMLSIVAAIAVFGTCMASAQSVQEIARNALESTVLLVMEDANGQPLSLGSGFLVGDGEIASNLHVVAGSSSGYAKLVHQETKYEINGIVAADPERDLVILNISGGRAPILPFGNSEDVRVGQTVYAAGNPQGLEGTFSQGIVSGIRAVGDDELLQITAPISHGSSGGPVLNGKGEVIGVSVAAFAGGQNLNFAIPSDYLKALLRRTGPPMPLRQAKMAETQQSVLAGFGAGSPEGVVASHFAWNDNSLMGYYTFSVRNNLREPIRDVLSIVIFYAQDGLPIETEFIRMPGPIGGRLARRSPRAGRLESDQVRNLTAKTEIRILDFRLAE